MKRFFLRRNLKRVKNATTSEKNVENKEDSSDDDDELLPAATVDRHNVLTELNLYRIESDEGTPVFICDICTEPVPVDDKFRIEGCEHFYCWICVSQYVGSKIEENVTTITCPVSGCSGKLDPQNCRHFLPKQVFDRWGDALCEGVISSSQKFYCPFKDCSSLLINDGAGVIKDSECPNCRRLFCAQCKIPWHPEMACADFQKLSLDERGREDILLRNLAKNKNWIRCPKCKFYVERTSGCSSIHCRCGCNFCYHCGRYLVEHVCPVCER